MNLKDLNPLASKLAGASDDLNAALATIQQKLNAKNLGVEVFLDNWADELKRTTSRDDDEDDIRELVIFELGYGRDDQNEEWGLVVREWHGREFKDPSGTWGEPEGDYGPVRPLLRAPRAIRARAVDVLPTLIEAIHAEASKLVSQVEKAKDLAKSLDDE